MIKEIDLQKDPPCKEVRRVRALVRRGLAIHKGARMWPDTGEFFWAGWGLTHVASGLSIYFSGSLPRVRQMMELCFEVRADWDVEQSVLLPQQLQQIRFFRDRLLAEDVIEEGEGGC